MKTSSLKSISEDVVSVFQQLASKNGPKIAVEFKNETITYEVLDQQSDLVCKHLISAKVQPGDFVGLCMDRSIGLIVWILGILKSGGIYLPLLRSIPKMRLEEILYETKCKYIVACQGSKSIFEEFNGQLIVTDDISLSGQVCEEIVRKVDPTEACCCIFTSGSSGKPKGVLISSRNIYHTSLGGFEYLELSSKNDRYASYASIVFTVSLVDIFAALLTGMCLVIIPEEIRRNPSKLMDYVNEKKITCLHLPPAMLKLLPRKKFDHELTFLRFGGETCDEETLKFWSSQVKCLINSYGLTESCATCMMKKDWKFGDEASNIGIAFSSDKKCYLLDDQMKPIQEVGVVGELFIESPQVASLGYLNLPKETNEKFVKNPFCDEEGRRILLRTGDFCHYNEKFEVIYRCRMDHQEKIRGNRVDLLEIENVIRKCDVVKDCVISVRRDQLGNKRIVAFAGYKVLFFDSYGKGFSSCPVEDYTVKLHVDLLDELLEVLELGDEKFHAVGVSFGGAYAYMYASSHLDRVKKLVIGNVSGFQGKKRLSHRILECLPDPIVNVLIYHDFFFHRYVYTHLKYKNIPKICKDEISLWMDHSLGFKRVIYSSIKNLDGDTEGMLKKINDSDIESLICWGEKETILPVSLAKKFKECLTKAELVLFEDDNHFSLATNEEFSNLIVDFLREKEK